MGKILLVDDDRDLANLTKTILVSQGHEVFVSYNAVKAIELAKQERPDLIFMDIMLPEISGAEAVKMLQNHPELKNIAVVFLTALVSREEEIEKRGIMIDDRVYKTLGKPYEINALLKIVDNIIGKPQVKK